MMKKQMTETIETYLPAKYSQILLSLAQSAVQILPVNAENTIDTACSKICGNPDLPAGMEWPKWNGRPLSFLLQINLKDVAVFPVAQDLPNTGLLSFFYDAQEQPWGFDPADRGRWKVFYFDTLKVKLLACSNPELNEEPDEGSLLQFKETLTLPPWGSKVVGAIGFTESEDDAYMELMDEMGENCGHQMFGCPAQVQDGDMQLECQLVTHGLHCGDGSGYKDPRKKELEKNAHQWHLLLQLDSDDGANMMWGDCGRLYFWIHEDDLKQAKFDNVWMILQCG